jgi:8-oxo-dGTP diphosphatase
MSRGERPRIRIVSAEIQEGGAFLLTQRLGTATLPLLWEFPGGRVRVGESDEDALRRALLDRIGSDASVGEQLLEIHHGYDRYDLVMCVYRCTLFAEPLAARVAQVRWVNAARLGTFEFPGADQKTVDLLLADGEH